MAQCRHCANRSCALPAPCKWPPCRGSTTAGKGEAHPAALLGPPRCDHLAPRVEVKALRAVDVRIAEERVAPATEAVEPNRDRDGHVDSDHPGFGLADEAPRGGAIAGED